MTPQSGRLLRPLPPEIHRRAGIVRHTIRALQIFQLPFLLLVTLQELRRFGPPDAKLQLSMFGKMAELGLPRPFDIGLSRPRSMTNLPRCFRKRFVPSPGAPGHEATKSQHFGAWTTQLNPMPNAPL